MFLLSVLLPLTLAASAAAPAAPLAMREAEARVTQLKILSGPVAEQSLKQAETNLVLARSEFVRI